MGKSMYVYRVFSDTGFAPCVDDGVLTLACCKGGRKDEVETGLRYWIGEKKETDYEADDVYVMGLYKENILYCAKITEVLTMKDYYSGKSNHRKDDIYRVVNNQVVHKEEYAIHEDEDQIKRDLSGKYVLISDKNNFYYFGNQCFGKEEIKEILKENFPTSRETRKLIHSEKVDRVLQFIEKNTDKVNFEIIRPNDIDDCNSSC